MEWPGPVVNWPGPEEEPEPCIGRDPTCPCADGLACHYKDYPADGKYPAVKGWPIPDDDGTTIVRGLD